MVSLKSLLVFLTLGAETLAAASPSLVCATDLGTKSIKNVPTSTATTVKRITVVKKVIRKVNVVVVPVAKTTTIRTTEYTTTTVVAGPETETETSTETTDVTITERRFNTLTTTSTTTTVSTDYFATTEARKASFTAILDNANLKERAVKNAAVVKLLTESDPLYPQRVRCTKEVPSYTTKVVTTTVQGPRTTLKPVTKTKMSTIISTITTTECPECSTTVTVTEEETITTMAIFERTNTVAQTVTIEMRIPQATVYAACDASNILSTDGDGGNVVGIADATSDTMPTIIGDNYSATSCCSECAKRPNCRISMLGRIAGLSSTKASTCSIFLTDDTSKCANGKQPVFARYITSDAQPAQPRYVYSNGPCGQLVKGGVAS
ncbi:hypothetical protein BKA59DRAFT_481509 [Fusarium tricinctum]|uniref:Apple domain-containing protein n=1 Tax=Fusarium tricinctum TaxID=61284 RepID=A0A8K0RPZ3_9HYPO|nr:hypothetical protein BKA59DRAFT_481509 [Fusarium tricinctum]